MCAAGRFEARHVAGGMMLIEVYVSYRCSHTDRQHSLTRPAHCALCLEPTVTKRWLEVGGWRCVCVGCRAGAWTVWKPEAATTNLLLQTPPPPGRRRLQQLSNTSSISFSTSQSFRNPSNAHKQQPRPFEKHYIHRACIHPSPPARRFSTTVQVRTASLVSVDLRPSQKITACA